MEGTTSNLPDFDPSHVTQMEEAANILMVWFQFCINLKGKYGPIFKSISEVLLLVNFNWKCLVRFRFCASVNSSCLAIHKGVTEFFFFKKNCSYNTFDYFWIFLCFLAYFFNACAFKVCSIEFHQFSILFHSEVLGNLSNFEISVTKYFAWCSKSCRRILHQYS